MAAVTSKRFNWVRQPTAWEQSQAWREKRALAREKFESMNATAVNGFSTAWSNQISGMANIASQMAVDRMKATYQAKLDAAINKLA
jgi:hypothetical protein